MMELLNNGGFVLALVSGAISSIVTIAAASSKLGKTVIKKINKEPIDKHEKLRQEVRTFMDEHKDCKPHTQKDIIELRAKVKELAKENSDIKKILSKDLASFRILFRIDDVVLDHCIYDNHIEECKQCKDELHQHILNR